MKAEAMRGKTADELKDMVMALRKEQMALRFQKAGGQTEDTAKLRVVRRDIARAKTLMNELKTGKTAKVAAKPTQPAPAKKTAKSKKAED